MAGILLFMMMPFMVFCASIIGYKLMGKWYVVPFVLFVLLALLHIVGDVHFVYVVQLTLLSVVISLIMKFYIKK